MSLFAKAKEPVVGLNHLEDTEVQILSDGERRLDMEPGGINYCERTYTLMDRAKEFAGTTDGKNIISTIRMMPRRNKIMADLPFIEAVT